MANKLIKALFRIIPMVARAIPFTSAGYIFLTALSGLAFGLAAPVNRMFFETLTEAVLNGGGLRYIYFGAAMVTAVMLLQHISTGVEEFYHTEILTPKSHLRLIEIIHAKIKNLPADMFEDKKYLDDIEKAGQGRYAANSLFTAVCDVIFNYGLYLCIMGVFLWRLDPVLLISFPLIFVPVTLSQFAEAKFHANLEDESAPIRRQNNHYTECLIGKNHVKETRLFGAYNFFNNLFMNSLNMLAQKEWDTQKKVTVMHLWLNAAKVLGWIGVLALLFRSLITGSITVGAFAAVFGSIGAMFGTFQRLFTRFNYSVTKNLGKIHNLINLLDIPETFEYEKAIPDFSKGIIAENISFSYPESEKNAVTNLSIKINPGETLALVGENGSGKTTLVKLLSGLYTPKSGTVSIGGCNPAKTSPVALFAKTSGVFQNYQCYVYSLEENIKISDTSSNADPHPAIVQADLDCKATFPKGIKTKLSPEYEGIELSGGQQQRVATARGLFRRHDFIILDEPTAAIDPLEETRLYRRFAKMTKGKIAVLVTHRLGSARIADRIVVMHNGQIVEEGTHEGLLAMKGKYAEMWAVQAGMLYASR